MPGVLWLVVQGATGGAVRRRVRRPSLGGLGVEERHAHRDSVGHREWRQEV